MLGRNWLMKGSFYQGKSLKSQQGDIMVLDNMKNNNFARIFNWLCSNRICEIYPVILQLFWKYIYHMFILTYMYVSVYPFLLWWLREYIYFLIIFIKSEVWNITYCLGLGHQKWCPLYVFLDSYMT